MLRTRQCRGRMVCGANAALVVLTLAAGWSIAVDTPPPIYIVVKFVEGLEIRLSEGRISGRPSSEAERSLFLKQRGVEYRAVEKAFASLNAVLKEASVRNITPLFSNEARGLQPEGPGPSGRDLRLYVTLTLKDPNPSGGDRLVARLLDLPIVETAYRAPSLRTPGWNSSRSDFQSLATTHHVTGRQPEGA